MEQKDIVSDVCESMEADYFYVGENIPNKKLKRLLKGLEVPNHEQIYALIDCTILGSAKYGAIFTNTGIYVKNDWTTDVREGYLEWESVIDADITYTDQFTKKEVWINNLHINMSGCSLSPTYLQEILGHIQDKLGPLHQHTNTSTSHELPPTPPSPPPVSSTQEQWMVTMQGGRYGPYETNTIGQMLMNGQLQAERDYIWKQGMQDWIPINDSETFQRYIVPPLPFSTPKTPRKEQDTMEQSYDTVDINHAELTELLTLPYLTLEKANELLLKRQKLGRFEHIEEVQEVIQIQPHQFEKLKQFIFIESSSSLQNEPRWGRTIDY